MKRSFATTVFAALVALPNVMLAQAASCPADTVAVTSPTVTVIVSGNTMCAARGGDRWQEYHQAGGALIDFKQGQGNPVDPTARVGSWSSNDGASTVTHDYGAGGSFTWLVCKPTAASTPLTLVSTGSAGTVTGVAIQSGGPSACP